MTEAESTELVRLVNRYCDSALDEVEVSQLQRLLRQDREARQIFKEVTTLHAALSWQKGSVVPAVSEEPARNEEVEIVPPVAPVESSRVVRLFATTIRSAARPVFWSTVAVASIFYGTFAVLSVNLRPDKFVGDYGGATVARAANPSMPPMTVAWLAEGGRAVWARGAEVPDDKARFAAGQTLELSRGVAVIAFTSGVRVAIQGPARLTLDSPMHASLAVGKLTANVPPRAIGFSVQTPNMLVVDLGTEFGVEVAQNGNNQVHVFKGEVELKFRAPESAVERKTPVRLQAGEGLKVDHAELNVRPVASDSGLFYCAEAEEPANIDLPIRGAYVSAIKRARPIAYWRFEEVVEDRYVRNEMRYDWPLRLCGEARLAGPWGYRRAVFDKDGVHRWMQVDAPMTELREDFSLQMFVKPAHVHEGDLISLIIPKNSPQHLQQFNGLAVPPDLDRFQSFSHVELLPDDHPTFPLGTVRFAYRNPPGIEGGSNAFSNGKYAVGEWQQITVTKSGNELKIYINGTLVGSARTERPHANIDPILVIGRLYGEGMSYGSPDSRLFAGELDEVAVYSRALSADEVHEHYRLSGIADKPVKD